MGYNCLRVYGDLDYDLQRRLFDLQALHFVNFMQISPSYSNRSAEDIHAVSEDGSRSWWSVSTQKLAGMVKLHAPELKIQWNIVTIMLVMLNCVYNATLKPCWEAYIQQLHKEISQNNTFLISLIIMASDSQMEFWVDFKFEKSPFAYILFHISWLTM